MCGKIEGNRKKSTIENKMARWLVSRIIQAEAYKGTENQLLIKSVQAKLKPLGHKELEVIAQLSTTKVLFSA